MKLPAILAALLLAAPLLTQQRDAESPALLRVESRDANLLRTLASKLGAAAFDWQLGEANTHGQLSLKQDLTVEQRLVAAPMRANTHAEVFGKPTAWLQAYAQELTALRRLLEPRVNAMLQQFGYPAGFGALVVADVFAFVGQLSGIHVRTEGDPEHLAKGFTVQLQLTPEADSPLLRYLQNLTPNPVGVPRGPGSALFLAQVSVNPERLTALTEPLAAFAVQHGAISPDEVAAARTRLDHLLDAIDGTFTAAWTEGQLLTIAGLRDAQAYAASLTDQAKLQQQQEAARRQHMDIEFRPAAFVHRNCPVLETVVESEYRTALLPGGSMTSWSVTAGQLALTVGGTKVGEDAAKAVIDQALDGKLTRAALTEQVDDQTVQCLLRVDLDLQRAAAQLPATLAASLPAAAELPRRCRLLLYRTGITLELRLELR